MQASYDNISPATIRRLMKEISDLLSNPPEGIKLVQNEEDVTDVQAIIDGPGLFTFHSTVISFCILTVFLLTSLSAGTPYEGGFFRIKLKLSPDFPASPPKGNVGFRVVTLVNSTTMKY